MGQLLVGKPVEIRCWAPSDWRSLTGQVEAYTGRPLPARETGGFVLVPGRANLSPRVCAQLVDLTYGPCEALPCPRTYRPSRLRSRLDLALAVVTLAHEAEHAVGVVNEAKAECRALQRTELAARALGAEPRYAAGLVTLYLTRIHETLPPMYRSPECRDGGTLDLRPASTVWP